MKADTYGVFDVTGNAKNERTTTFLGFIPEIFALI